MNIEYKLDTEFRGAGVWHAYSLQSEGITREEVISNAYISETDQDGGELNTYLLIEAEYDVQKEALHLIERLFNGYDKTN